MSNADRYRRLVILDELTRSDAFKQFSPHEQGVLYHEALELCAMLGLGVMRLLRYASRHGLALNEYRGSHYFVRNGYEPAALRVTTRRDKAQLFR